MRGLNQGTVTVGIGPIRFGMRPGRVRALFSEEEVYEKWMGGNLNDSILYRGLIIGFGLHDTWGPLPLSKFCEVFIHGRDDATLWEKNILDWRKADVIAYLENSGFKYQLGNFGNLSVPQLSLSLSFDDADRLTDINMWANDFVETRSLLKSLHARACRTLAHLLTRR